MGLFVSTLTCAIAVILAGIILGRSADAIAATTGLGRVWTGAVLLAIATSLPELVTDVSAMSLHVPNLAAGDLFGSSLANMFILGVVSLFAVGERAPKELSPGSVLTIWLSIVLIFLGAMFVLFPFPGVFWGLRPESMLLLVIYLVGLRTIYRCSPTSHPGGSNEEPIAQSQANGRYSLVRSAAEFAMGAGLIFWAGPRFAVLAEQFANASGLGNSFVGTLLVGFSTALPEFVTSLTAVRIGAFDLAVATLYGSSACNMAIFFALDLASPGKSIFASIGPIHALSGFLAMGLMVLGLVTVVRGPLSKRFAIIEPAGGLMVGSYVLSLWLLHVYAG